MPLPRLLSVLRPLPAVLMLLAASAVCALKAWSAPASAATRMPPVVTPKVEWTPVYYKGRSYVPVTQVAAYYGLRPPEVWTRVFTLRREKLSVELSLAEKRVKLNGWTFFLSFPIVRTQDVPMISVFDVRNLLDPILQPTARRDPAVLRTVIIDASGGGRDPGIQSPAIAEKDLTLEVAKVLGALLQKNGYKVLLTRDSDKLMPAAQRVLTANGVTEESVYINLSAASSSSTATKGFECSTLPPAGTPATNEADSPDIDKRFFPGNINDRESLALAWTVQNRVVSEASTIDLGIRRVRVDELRDLRMPAISCRLGYLSNKEEAKKLATESYRAQIAVAIVHGVDWYAGVLKQDLEERAKEDRQRPLRFGPVTVKEEIFGSKTTTETTNPDRSVVREMGKRKPEETTETTPGSESPAKPEEAPPPTENPDGKGEAPSKEPEEGAPGKPDAVEGPPADLPSVNQSPQKPEAGGPAISPDPAPEAEPPSSKEPAAPADQPPAPAANTGESKSGEKKDAQAVPDPEKAVPPLPGTAPATPAPAPDASVPAAGDQPAAPPSPGASPTEPTPAPPDKPEVSPPPGKPAESAGKPQKASSSPKSSGKKASGKKTSRSRSPAEEPMGKKAPDKKNSDKKPAEKPEGKKPAEKPPEKKPTEKPIPDKPASEGNQGDRITLRLPIIPSGFGNIDRSQVELQVFLFESVNGAEIDLTTSNPPETKWLSVLPDWKAGVPEWFQISYLRPPFNPIEVKQYGKRSYYGYVARLIYAGRLMDEISYPPNLNRCLYYFTPVFPRR